MTEFANFFCRVSVPTVSNTSSYCLVSKILAVFTSAVVTCHHQLFLPSDLVWTLWWFDVRSEMFVNTKMDDGPCGLVHSEELKEKFERDNDPFKYDSLIERDFLARIVDIDRSIKVMYTTSNSILFVHEVNWLILYMPVGSFVDYDCRPKVSSWHSNMICHRRLAGYVPVYDVALTLTLALPSLLMVRR